MLNLIGPLEIIQIVLGLTAVICLYSLFKSDINRKSSQ